MSIINNLRSDVLEKYFWSINFTIFKIKPSDSQIW